MPAVEQSVREGEEPVKLPPTVQINKLSDKFKEALGRMPEKAPTPPPPEKPPINPPEKPGQKPLESPTPLTLKADKPAEPPKDPKIPREHFKALEAQRDEFKTKWEAAEAKAREVEAKAKALEEKVPTDYDQLKSRVAELTEREQKFYLEHSPEFQAAFDQKITAGIEEAKEAVGATHAERMADLLSLPPSAKRDAEIDEITADLSPYRQAALARASMEVRRLQKDRAAELAKTKENVKHIESARAQAETKAKVARQEALERSLRVTQAEMAKETVHFQRIEGNEEHNQRVAEAEKMLKEFTTSDLAPDDHARLAAWAVRGIRAAQLEGAKDALIAKLQAELKEIQSATPSPAGGGKAGPADKPLSAAEKYKLAMERGVPPKD